MGKTQKVSKGQLSHFVPDYRHAVETRFEIERTGSLGRADTDMNPSEGSRAQKRRCVSLNGDNNDSFGVPIQVFPVSQMSYSERKALKCRLNNELQHIQILQQRLPPITGSNVQPSQASNIRGSCGGIRRPAVENLSRPISEVTVPKGKKKPPKGRNGPHTKGALARRPESVKPVSSTICMLMKQCENLLQRLMSHAVASIFNEPVDIVKSNIPDYFTIIKQPMDLGTVKSKLLSERYSDPLGFAADVRLTFNNAMTYNPQGNGVHIMAKTLSKFFEVRWKQIEKKLLTMVDFPLPSKPISNNEGKTATSKPLTKENKGENVDHDIKQKSVKRVMTDEEKQKLRAKLEVSTELNDQIIDYLQEISTTGTEPDTDELEIDFESFTDDILFTLRDMFNAADRSIKQKSEGKADPCEIELRNESGFSNSSMHPCKGNDLADEDVDIGGNDAPISSFPLLEIEKDGACHNNKYGSSSSSSSDSGSSSTDSDMGSASPGDSDGLKNRAQVNEEKEICSSGESLEQEGSNIGVTATGIGDILNGNVQPNSVCNFDCGSSIGYQEGEGNAPLERQVSPGNNYRAAILRERFADTILKAQEKAHEKDAKRDPDRLRLEREEYKRKKKEEARAAEVAQRKVEAEAAAEAKRKRELEREAARQALQKMEKTVDINENTRFLEDLEILKSAPEQSLLGGTSLDDDQNGLGSLNLHASSNPLELLGLYMKDDNDEEEEGEPQDVKDEAEEGEID